MQTIPHHISAVTVFEKEAQITRTAQINLTAGEHTLIFDDMPTTLREKTLQVNGIGHAILNGVKYQKEYQNVGKNEAFEALKKQKKEIQNSITLTEQKIKRLQQEKVFVENIAQKTTSPSENNTQTELSTEKWLNMLQFYQQNLEKIDAQLWENTQISEKQKETLEEVRFATELNQTTNKNNKVKWQVHVTVQMLSEGSLTLLLSYIVGDAGWIPMYDLRVDTQTKKMNITYNAFIKQYTGEDWENITLKLSTAKPSINGTQPELSPWRVSIYTPTLRSHETDVFAGAVNSPSMVQMHNMMPKRSQKEEEREEADDFLSIEGEKGMEVNIATVDTKTSSVFFEIGGLHTLKYKDDKNKVTIFVGDFEAHFRYSCVPKLSKYAYLKAKVVNNSEYPFLAGESNIFLDNNFVATAQIPTVAPSEDFWTYLGIDEGMKIEHKFLKKYETKETGFFSKKTTSWLYEYVIKVKSFKKQVEELVIFDQIPITENSNIKITLLDPPYKEDTDKLKKDEWNFVEWFFNIKPNEEIIIPFKFSVEYPNDAMLTGI